MANHTNLNSLFTSMAEAIRSKTGSTSLITADNFPDEIDNIRTGFDYNNSEVTTIPDYAFYGCEDLYSIDCSNLTSIGNNAFENCTNLKSIILYDGVTSIGENAFKGCSEDLVIYCMFDSKPEGWNDNWNPDNHEVVWLLVEKWDISATEEDNVTAKLCIDTNNEGKYSLIIGGEGNMKNYSGGMAPWNKYYSNDIASIVIPDSVTSIGGYAFDGCKSLANIAFEGTTSQWNAISKGQSWNYGVPATYVQCSDGQVAL